MFTLTPQLIQQRQIVLSRRQRQNLTLSAAGLTCIQIAALEPATFNNLEHQNREFVIDTLQPLLTRLKPVPFE